MREGGIALMKKRLYIGCLTFSAVMCLTSCNSDLDLSKLAVIHSDVYARYENTAKITFDSEFALDGITFYDSAAKENVVFSLVPGDKLSIYYSNSGVEHVFVDKASVIQIDINISVAPGNDRVEMFTDASGIVIDSSKIEYIICNDGSFVPVSDYSDFDVFYGTYNPENNIQTTEFTTLIQLEAVYSFSPR